MLIPQPYLTQKLAQKKREKSHSIQRKVRLSENQPQKARNILILIYSESAPQDHFGKVLTLVWYVF